MKQFVKISLLILCAALAQSCSVIDDDLSVCQKDPNLELRLNLNLHTELQLEVNTRLNADIYQDIRPLIINALSDIFSDRAHDINAIFYLQRNNQLEHSISDIIDSNQSSYAIYLPADNYDAIALANIKNNGIVTLLDTVINKEANLQVERRDTVSSQRTGLFRAARAVEITDAESQTIDIHLTQVNAAVVLVVDTTEYQPLGVKAVVDETASGMNISDSTFLFDRHVVVRAEDLNTQNIPHAAADPDSGNDNGGDTPAEEHKFQCLAAVTMPSRDNADDNGAYFTVKAYVTLNDGTVTENILSVKEPLPAGQIVIIKLNMADKGVITPVEDSQVGATVKLDWKHGGEHDIEL